MPENDSVIGTTTETQMLIGVYWGYVAMIEGLVARLKAEIGRPAKVIATGGLAGLFEKHTAVFDAIEPDLTIQGLAMLAEPGPIDALLDGLAALEAHHGSVALLDRLVGLVEAGPVVPMQAPTTFGQMTKYRLVSIGRPGPTMVSHQPGFCVTGWMFATC